MGYVKTDSEFAIREKVYQRIETALSSMPSDLREIFVLTHYQGKSAGEIAAARNLDRPVLDRLLVRANRAFFQALKASNRVSSQ